MPESTTQTRPQATRTLRWVPNADDWSPVAGALTITIDGKATTYTVTEFPLGLPGRGFQLATVGGIESYGVECGPRQTTCECYDSLYRRRACKHIAAVRKLIELGRI